MTLLHHWKLDDNATDSQGLVNGSASNVTWTAGKIKNCGSFNGTNSTINFGTGVNFFPLPELSISIWFKSYGTTPTTGTAPGILGFTYGIRLLVYADYINFGVDNGTTGTYISSPTTYDFYNDDKWHHIVATISPTQKNLYVDGEHVGTLNDTWLGTTRWPTNTCYLGRDNNDSMYYFTGLLDDFRIYDHIISAKEAKELSKAKILHLNFNQFAENTTNVVTNTNLDTGWSKGYCTGILWNDIDPPPGIDSPVVSFYDADTNNNAYWYSYGNYAPQVPDTTYTCSIYIKTVDPNFTIKFYTADNAEVGRYNSEYINVPNDGQWHRIVWPSFHNIATSTSDSLSFHFTFGAAQGESQRTWLCAPQLEAKSYVTPFVVGSRTDSVYDCSEYNNNAILESSASPKWMAGGKLGSGYYDFYADRVKCPANLGITDNLTLTCWVKLDEIRESGFIQSDFYLSCDSTGHLRAYWYGTSLVGYHISPNILPLDEWIMVSAVWNGSTCKLYENDNEVFSVDTLTPGSANITYVAIGTEGETLPPSSSRQIHGAIDDVKIFATALSVDDISQLYKNRASIDDKGNLYATEIIENENWDEDLNNNNLLYNGNAELGDNTNFSSLTYNDTEKCFTYTSTSSSFVNNEYIPINGDELYDFDTYKLEGMFKQPAGDLSKYYFMLYCYDRDFNFIHHQKVAYYNSTKTFLTADLNDGDQYVYLDDVSNWWDDTLDQYVHTKTFACWPSDTAKYPKFTYSQHIQSATYVDHGNSRIKLNGTWTQGHVPAGSYAINSRSGGGYSYIGASNALMTTDWVYRSGITAPSISNLRAGTAYVKIGCLINRNVTSPVTSYIKNLKFYNISNPQSTSYSIDKASPHDNGIYKAKEFVEGGFPKSKYLDYNDWVLGTNGSQGAFSRNGAATENYIINYNNPWGYKVPTWLCQPDATSNGDGGWNTTSFTIDNSKTLRFSLFVKKTGTIDGTTYFGCLGSNTLNLAGTSNTNPYFWNGELPSLNEWYLMVGVIHPNGYSGADLSISGVYNMNGTQVINATEFQCGTGNTQNMRAYLYYSTDQIVTQYFVYPRVDILEDVDCPSIEDLIMGKEMLVHHGNSVVNINDNKVLHLGGHIKESY